MHLFVSFLFFLASAAHLDQITLATPSSSIGACKSFPGDVSFSSDEEWAALNATVGGRLVATVPLGSPCHDPHFNAELCATLQSEWLSPPVHYNSSSSVMAPLFANRSCDPFQPRNSSCTLGNYVVYAVNASGADDIAAAVRFSDAKNVRLVIRNTGHDYLGRSTGAGALAVWTHYLKDIEVTDWADASYTGKALKVGAGVQGFEAIEAAAAAGLVVVTGECPTVGIAGGYTQGGGHSALSTVFGLSADNTLEFEVVLADGRLVTAARSSEYADLYWALSGGGAGNYGVVVSMTVRAHPDAPVSGAMFSVDAPLDRYPAIVDAFHAALPAIVDSGIMIIYFFGEGLFSVPAMTAYNRTQTEAQAALAPFVQSLAALNVTLQPTFTSFASYRDHFGHYWGPLPAGNIQVGVDLFGGRLIPRDVLPRFGPTARTLIDLGITTIGVGLNVSRFGGGGANAVLPQWRDSLVSASLVLPYSFSAPFAEMRAAQETITRIVQPVVEAATPGAGAYMNEADFQQPRFEDVFFGANYGRLLGIKRKYDPEGLFYATAAVGSEAWTVTEDGRLCATQ
ncbi:hypothetical protein GGX14DRAFT_552786 [Mycena pura]|uniref:FAD-binding PCMH-type domain-containing protein n=1 Tax=Mycena pura TaxID=153505 RepID=A0AAD6Y376_9AGAR|nr:hypothetical protein GGX14DRAFT_552786 [Mycena pura]